MTQPIQSRTNYSVELKQKAVDLVASGHTSIEIEDILNVPNRAVRLWASMAGVKSHFPKERKPLEVKLKAIELYQQGWGTVVIGRQIGVCPSLIWHWLKNAKITTRSIPGETRKLQYDIGLQKRVPNMPITIKRPSHPRSGIKGYIGEHILVWEESHNKPLPKGWIVHHLNGIKDDNRPENLVGLPTMKHNGLLPVKARRIRELEIRIKQLERALDSGQFVFKMGEN